MKKILFVFFLVLFVVGITAWVVSGRPATVPLPAALPTPTTYPWKNVPTLTLPTAIHKSPGVEFVLDLGDISSFPPSLPVFVVSDGGETWDERARRIAKTLGIKGGGALTQTPMSGYLSWVLADGGTLSVQEKPGRFSYRQQVSLSAPAPDVLIAQSAVLEFLSQRGFVSADIKTGLVGGEYIKTNGLNVSVVPSAQQGDAASVRLRYLLNGYPYFSSSSVLGDISSLVGNGNVIVSVSALIPPRFSGAGKTPLIPVSSAILALQNNRGSLVSLENANEGESSLALSSLSRVRITSVEIVYARGDGDLVKPAYAFRGSVLAGEKSSIGAKVVFFVSSSLD